eukprot:TRINITY_DN473_c0_g1_i3.p1 TRINITY_DN473_c0_g1~~TRINITY_DN473_c0_g1_i3.p1  ORF type:complete len:352 (-),score=48.98 TRINITY_DN473_c0_g1_i3:253-1308(-)
MTVYVPTTMMVSTLSLKRMLLGCVLALLVSVSTVHAQYACSNFGAAPGNTSALVNIIDHVLLGVVPSNGTNYTLELCEAIQLFMNSSMGFPNAWPCATFGPITSGGLAVGGVNVELIPYTGFSFQPCQSDSNVTSDLLDGHHINNSVIPSPTFDNVMIDALCTETTLNFFCEYTEWDQSESRETYWRQLLSQQFGRGAAAARSPLHGTDRQSAHRAADAPQLGVLYAEDLSVLAANQSVVDIYTSVLLRHLEENVGNNTSRWYLEGGPTLSVTLVSDVADNAVADTDVGTTRPIIQVSTLSLAVASLNNAVLALKANGVFGGLTASGCAVLDLSLKFPITVGVSIVLCEVS